MGIRGEIFSSKVILPNRTYFFNVKENRMGDLYLNIVESKNRDNGGFERQSVILFAEDLQEFLKGFDESLKVLEKATRDKKKKPSRKDFEPKVRKTSSGEKEDFNKGEKHGGGREHGDGREHGGRRAPGGRRTPDGKYGERPGSRDVNRGGNRNNRRDNERGGGRGTERGGREKKGNKKVFVRKSKT